MHWALARNIVNADPSAVVLVVCVELSTLHFAYGFDAQKIVANALFADGGFGCDCRRKPRGRFALGTGVCTTPRAALLPDTLDAMTWRIRDHGFEMALAPELPAIIRANVRSWCERLLDRAGLGLSDVRNWAVHPGGPKILTAVVGRGNRSHFRPMRLQVSRDILAQHRNMSSPRPFFSFCRRCAAHRRGVRDGASCVAMWLRSGAHASKECSSNAEPYQ